MDLPDHYVQFASWMYNFFKPAQTSAPRLLQLTVTCTVLTSGLEMSLEAMHSYDPDCSLVMAFSSTCSPSVTNLWVPAGREWTMRDKRQTISSLICGRCMYLRDACAARWPGGKREWSQCPFAIGRIGILTFSVLLLLKLVDRAIYLSVGSLCWREGHQQQSQSQAEWHFVKTPGICHYYGLLKHKKNNNWIVSLN